LKAVADLLGAAVGYYTPWLGRSTTADWTIAGSHLAERCQGFILIALGESIVIIGATLASLSPLAAPEIIAFVTAFTGAVALWWIYFDRSADESERGIASFNRSGSTRPLRLSLRPPRHGRRDHRDGRRRRAGSLPPGQRGSRLDRLDDSWRDGSFGWARGVQLTVWRVISWTRLAALLALASVGLLGPHLSAVALGSLAAAVIIAFAISDRMLMGWLTLLPIMRLK